MYCKLVATSKKLNDDIKEQLEELDKICFPLDTPYPKKGSYWWIMYDKDKPVAFAGIKTIPEEKSVFLCRCGVIEEYRGKGIQKRLIKIRENFIKRTSYKDIITYTHYQTLISANNLIANGYKLYDPANHWASLLRKETLYFRKHLD